MNTSPAGTAEQSALTEADPRRARVEGREEGARTMRASIAALMTQYGVILPVGLPMTLGERKDFERSWDRHVAGQAPGRVREAGSGSRDD